MWTDNKIVKEDLEYINSCGFIPWEKLRNKTIFVTGATGLIGQNLINGLLYSNIKKNLNIKVIALIRNIDKANEKFKNQLQETKALEFIIGDVRNFEYPKCNIDYIVHGASITASKDFIEKSLEVKNIAVDGTKHLLELAREKKVSSFVYLSSMEVYGYPKKGHVCKEDESWIFDLYEPRNSYPIAKLECENICKDYCKKYDISTKSIRLTQTFGPGAEYNDSRVFVEFARCVLENRNIVLHTKGETERCYLYTADAITAILTVLLSGNKGEIYNAANAETYCSIKEMAENIVHNVSKGKIDIVFDNNNNNKYFNKTYLKISTHKLERLKWEFCKDFNEKSNNYMYIYLHRIIEWMKQEYK